MNDEVDPTGINDRYQQQPHLQQAEEDNEEDEDKPAASVLTSLHTGSTPIIPATATTTGATDPSTADDVDPVDEMSTLKRRRSSGTTSARRKYLRSLKPDELYVDFYGDSQIVSSRWGHDRLDRYIAIPELDLLVGWATHTTSSSLSPASPLFQNPLLGLATSNTPLQPSILKHLLQDPATRLLQAIDERNDEWTATYGLVEHHKMRSATRSKGPLWECFQHSAAVALGMLAEEMLTALLLPLAQRHVQRCRHRQDQETQYGTQTNSRNATAPNAADLERNHILQQDWTLPPEEAILALILPADSSSTTNTNLILDMVIDETSASNPVPFPAVACLATALPPTRTTIVGGVGTSMLNIPQATERDQQAVAAWYRRHSRNLQQSPCYHNDNNQSTGRTSAATATTHSTHGLYKDILRLFIPQLPS